MKKVIYFTLYLLYPFFCQSQSIQKLFSAEGANAVYISEHLIATSNKGFATAGVYSNNFPNEMKMQFSVLDSQLNIKWFKIIDIADSMSYATRIIPTSDSGFAVSGIVNFNSSSTTDIFILKTDKEGNVQWVKSYGGNNWDFPSYLIELTGGGYMILGQTESFGGQYGRTYCLRINSNGDTLWTKTFGNDFMFAQGRICSTADSNYIFVGDGPQGILVVKLADSGDTLWTKQYYVNYYPQSPDSNCCHIPYGIALTNDNGFIITSIIDENSKEDISIVKIDSVGNPLWAKRYFPASYPNARPAFIEQGPDGDYYVTGCVNCAGYANPQIFLMKTDINGNFLWGATYGHDNMPPSGNVNVEDSRSVLFTDSGKIIIGGTTSHFNNKLESYIIVTDSVSVANSNGCFEQAEVFTQMNVGVAVFSGIEVGATQTLVNDLTWQYVNYPVKDSLLCQSDNISELVIKENDITIYPNPNTGKFSVFMNIEQKMVNYELKIYNIIGEQIYSSFNAKPQRINNEIDLSTQPFGIYFYQIYNGEKSYRGKIIKD